VHKGLSLGTTVDDELGGIVPFQTLVSGKRKCISLGMDAGFWVQPNLRCSSLLKMFYVLCKVPLLSDPDESTWEVIPYPGNISFQ